MKAYRSLLFFWSILFILIGLCYFYPEDGITIGNKTLKFPSLAQVMERNTVDRESAEDKLKRAEEELRLQIERDSLARVYEAEKADSLAYIDTLKSYQKLVFASKARIECAFDDLSPLYALFNSLDNCKNGNESIHILHYGDSQIEQDRITSYIREKLQEKFGGWGAGLVPAIQPIPSISVGQATSDSIPRYIADGTLRQKLSHNRYGVLAQMAELNGSVTLSISARNWKKTYSRVKKFSKISLLVGNTSDKFSATLSYDGKDTTQVIKTSCADMKKLTWQLKSPINKFNLQLRGKGEIYGISMESKNGVFVDNIPLRGSSGTFFTKISSHLLSESMNSLNVKLVIMEFGGNATPYLNTEKSIAAYKESMGKQIAYVKKLYPKTQILLIGPADMSTRIDGELQTYPFLENTIEALKSVALENDAMFWNMYEVMGGRNSMVKWVSHSPAWASSDYIHFTEKGAGRIAEVFIQSFMNCYDYYQFLKRNKKWSGVE